MLLKMGLITAEDILKAKASMYGMEFRRISPEKVNKLAFEKLELDFIKNNNVVPVDIEQDCLLIATSEPANVFVLEDVKRQTKMDIKTIVCTPEDIENVCSSFSETGRIDYNVDDLISDMGEVELREDCLRTVKSLLSSVGKMSTCGSLYCLRVWVRKLLYVSSRASLL